MNDAKGISVFEVIKGFRIRRTTDDVNGEMPSERLPAQAHTNINACLTFKPRESSTSRFSQTRLALADEIIQGAIGSEIVCLSG
jgi:hypothetical protein